MPLADARPEVSQSAFVAPNAAVVGNVTLGERTAVWYGAVLRADMSKISVGSDSSIGDRVVINSTAPVHIGRGVSVGAGAVLEGAVTLADACVVGAHAVISGPCEIAQNAIINPGAVVSPGTKIAAGQVWGGVPAKHERNLNADEIASIATLAQNNLALATKHAAEHAKSEAVRQKERDFKELHRSEESLYKETPF
jgi:gamma-carbonic anhydrase